MHPKLNTQPEYFSYLVRLWRASGNTGQAWRASLEVPLTQELLHFESLANLFAFLETLTGQAHTGQGTANPDTPWPEAQP